MCDQKRYITLFYIIILILTLLKTSINLLLEECDLNEYLHDLECRHQF